MKTTNINSQITTNITKTWLIMGIFVSVISGLIYLLTSQLGMGQNSLTMAFGFTILMSLSGYFFGDKMVLAMHGAKEVNEKDQPEYFKVTRNLARRAGIPMPKLYIIDSPSINAFATGKSPNSGIVCITKGIKERLTKDELAAVIAHELAHIKNYDILLMTVASILVGLLGQLIHILQFNSLLGNSNDREERSPLAGIISMVLVIFAPIIGTLLQLAISRRREFLADATAANLTQKPQDLIEALKKISQDHIHFNQAQPATANLYIANPFKGRGEKLASLFSTHPPISERIKALESMR